MKKIFIKLTVVFMTVLSGMILSACGSSKSETSEPAEYDYLAEIRALGFPTAEVDHYISLAMDQYNCKNPEVTSVEADGEWSVKLYMNVDWSKNFKSEVEQHKVVLQLWFEPSDGSIWSADLQVVDEENSSNDSDEYDDYSYDDDDYSAFR